MDYELSKTKYCKGIQCPKILWMDENMPEVGENVLSATLMKNGTKVGEVARDYFGDCDLVEFDFDKTKMAEKTNELLQKGSANIAEAAFYVDGL